MSLITIVTGLPRSGTSLMMQVFNESNIPVLTDGVREKDENNTEGYYELDDVKRIVKDNSFLQNAQGMVLKIVCPLPLFLDLNFNYRVIVMRRNMNEILTSQEKMLNKNQQGQRLNLSKIYESHLSKMYSFFEQNKIEYIDVFYSELVDNPESVINGVIGFCELTSEIEELKSVVNPSLYRNRDEKR